MVVEKITEESSGTNNDSVVALDETDIVVLLIAAINYKSLHCICGRSVNYSL